ISSSRESEQSRVSARATRQAQFALLHCFLPDTIRQALYSSSLTFSIHSTALPLSCSTIAMCVMAVAGVAPCQCFSLGGHQTTSPARISCFGPPSLCTQPQPDVTISVCPSGCVCHAV